MTEGPILFFDGVCNLCNNAVQFIIRHDKEGKIRFASLQSEAGKSAKAAVLAKKASVPDSLIFLENDIFYTESDAALHVAKYLDGGWQTLRYLNIFPRFLRDAVYRLIARYRYKLFGVRDTCMIPTQALRQRFLE
jgi:predicted DCC family thiol-disulfide oxidoreductase YuxK